MGTLTDESAKARISAGLRKEHNEQQYVVFHPAGKGLQEDSLKKKNTEKVRQCAERITFLRGNNLNRNANIGSKAGKKGSLGWTHTH